MKEHLLLINFALIISVSSYSQTGNGFKSPEKDPYGTTESGFTYRVISGNSGFKSGPAGNVNSSFHVAAGMEQPYLNDDSIKNVHYQNGIPVFFEKDKSKLKSASNESAEEHFYKFHQQAGQRTKLKDPAASLVITRKSIDD